jgi:hypothetical protein
MKEKLLEVIIKKYLDSYDFNGVPTYKVDANKEELVQLLDEEQIEILTEKYVLNPHIKAFDNIISVDKQKDEIKNNYDKVVIYPTVLALKNIRFEGQKYFTNRIIKGEAKLNIIYFKSDIIQEYCNNPKYIVNFNGYLGTIYLKDEFADDDEKEYEYIKDFGVAYNKKDNTKRAIGVFLDDVARLSEEDQLKWYIKMQKNQDEYVINYGFYENLILGNWLEDIPIYEALLDEIKIINKMCEKMQIPHLFNREYNIYDDNINDYRTIFLPTQKNYDSFMLVLEKMLVHNLNYYTFTKGGAYTKNVDRNDNLGKPKGSLILFLEWLNINIKGNDTIEESIINPLKHIRKERQKPAHELMPDQYDENIWKKQNELISKTYDAIRHIRLTFSNHPLCKEVVIDKYLIDGKHIKIF